MISSENGRCCLFDERGRAKHSKNVITLFAQCNTAPNKAHGKSNGEIGSVECLATHCNKYSCIINANNRIVKETKKHWNPTSGQSILKSKTNSHPDSRNMNSAASS